MFTGLIQDIGVIRSIDDSGVDKRIVVETGIDLSDVSIGASIACSGVCLSVTAIEGNSFAADVSGETLAVSALNDWQVGTKINLERSLCLGDELGGHLVSGHVDGVSIMQSLKSNGESYRFRVSVPEELSAFIAPKGSVTLDGVSLTVNEVEGDVFGVNIIPHTWEKTTLGLKSVGDGLNIEIDMLARYIARMMERRVS